MPGQDELGLEPGGCKPRVGCRRPPAGRAHLIGIAGSGMRSLAGVLAGWGWELTGSDLDGQSAPSLLAAGVRVHTGHAAAQLPPQTDLVVYSDAIRPENPELRRAAALGIPTASYFQTLGRLMSGRRGLAVAGTHGKSTTTAMAAEILVEAGLDPTVVYGAAPVGHDHGGRAGGGKPMLVEACEYRANFLRLRPEQAVILGIEPDHFDCYDSLDRLKSAFARFAALVPEGGLMLARRECPATGQVTAGLPCRVETFDFDPGADWSARPRRSRRGRYEFGMYHHGRHLGNVRLRVPGRHNVLNALAAAALAWENGVGAEAIAAGLGRFRGLRRRLEGLGSWRGVTLIDDYAHHPTEVAASLETVRRMYPGRRLWCVFQPHQASRTEHLLDELAASLHNADRVVVAEIFRAREPLPRRGEVTAADLAGQLRALGSEVPDVHADEPILELLRRDLLPGDVLVTMGAGDIRKIYDGLTERIREDRAAG